MPGNVFYAFYSFLQESVILPILQVEMEVMQLMLAKLSCEPKLSGSKADDLLPPKKPEVILWIFNKTRYLKYWLSPLSTASCCLSPNL